MILISPLQISADTVPSEATGIGDSSFSQMYNPNATSEFAVYDKEGNYEWYRSYGPGGSENICLTGTSGGTKEMAANNVYQMFKGSSAHWSDITKAEYTGVGIGIVIKYDKDRFDNIYCCILTMDRTYG